MSLFTILFPVSLELFISTEMPKILSQTTNTIKIASESAVGEFIDLLNKRIPIITISE